MQDFRNVDAWKKAHLLTLRIYRQTQSLPKEEVFGVTIQLRRSAVSIAAKIAEGCGKNGNVEFAPDLRRAAATTNELEYLVVLTRDLQLWNASLSEETIADVAEVRKMIYGLLRTM